MSLLKCIGIVLIETPTICELVTQKNCDIKSYLKLPLT